MALLTARVPGGRSVAAAGQPAGQAAGGCRRGGARRHGQLPGRAPAQRPGAARLARGRPDAAQRVGHHRAALRLAVLVSSVSSRIHRNSPPLTVCGVDMVTLLILEVIPHTRVAGSETGINHFWVTHNSRPEPKAPAAARAALQRNFRKPSQSNCRRGSTRAPSHSWEVGVTATLA